jgi:hypothetical protein
MNQFWSWGMLGKPDLVGTISNVFPTMIDAISATDIVQVAASDAFALLLCEWGR